MRGAHRRGVGEGLWEAAGLEAEVEIAEQHNLRRAVCGQGRAGRRLAARR